MKQKQSFDHQDPSLTFRVPSLKTKNEILYERVAQLISTFYISIRFEEFKSLHLRVGVNSLYLLGLFLPSEVILV